MRMSIDDVNARGGVKAGGKTYRYEPILVDDKLTSEGGREAANRLVLAEKVQFIVGSLQVDTAGAQAITEPNKVLVLANSAADRSLGSTYPLTLQAGIAHQRMRVPAVYEWLSADHPEVKSVAIIQSDDVNGQGYADTAEAAAKAKNLVVVAREFFPTDIKDFTPLVTRVLRQAPEAIDIGGAGAGVYFTSLAKALYDQGFRNKPIMAVAADTNAIRQNIAILDGFLTAVLIDYTSDVVSAQAKAIIKRYIDAYGETELEVSNLSSYNIPFVLKQAIEKAGGPESPENIAQLLRDNTWETIFGQQSRFVGARTFGLAAVLEQPIYLSKVEAGKLVTFKVLKGTMD
jgi:branched-chain amino acid transport system substrate-binding protein